jgi:hypothetical protein
MADLEAELSIEGLNAGEQSFTDMGKAVENFEPLAERLAKALGSVSATLDTLSSKVDAEVKDAGEREKKLDEKQNELDKKKHEEDAKNEQARLQAKVAQLVGGGINTAAYAQALDKVKEQEDAIQEAAKRGLLTTKEKVEALGKLKVQYAKLATEQAVYNALGQGAIGRLAATTTSRLMSIPGKTADAVGSQISGVGSGLMGLMGGLPIAGGIFGLMMYGVMNQDRLNQQAGEILNIASATAGNLTSSGSAWLTGFQEKAQKYYAINKSEVQGLLSTFKDAGFNISSILSKQSNSLGEVGTNIMTLTLGIDKHFELATGSSARSVVTLTNDFGMKVKDAGELYEKMAFAGSRSGIGVQNFVNYVQQGAGALRQYGVSVENTAVVLVKLQEQYERMGMPKALAGTQAGIALGQISGGMANLSASMQGYMAERMGMGSGIEARMHFREGMERLSSGGANNSFLSDFIKQARQMALESTGGDTAMARYFLEQQGFGFEGAKGIIAIGDKLEKGQSLESLSINEQKQLKDAFMTEGQKQSQIQSNMNRILAGMADIGQGLLKIVTNFVGWGIVFFKTLMVRFTGTDEEKKRAQDELNTFSKGMREGASQIWGGKDDSGGFKGLASGFKGMLAPIAKPLTDAIEWDPFSSSSSTPVPPPISVAPGQAPTKEQVQAASVEQVTQSTTAGHFQKQVDDYYRKQARDADGLLQQTLAAANGTAANIEINTVRTVANAYQGVKNWMSGGHFESDEEAAARAKAGADYDAAHVRQGKTVVIHVEANSANQQQRPSTRTVMEQP